MKVGFIGLGTLGKTMAKRFIAEGVELAVWNRTVQKADDLHIQICSTPGDLISQSEIVFMNLFDSDAVDQTLNGVGGVLSGDCKGKVIVDTTTNHFHPVLKFHDLVKANGAYYLEAPVLGSVVPASKGALTVLVSGDKGAYNKALPLIEKIGSKIFFLGEEGLASKMKLINNLALGSFMATLGEALSLGEKVGIEKEKILNILDAGGGNSLVLNAKKEKLLKEDFSTHFSVACIYKDLHCLQDLAKEIKSPLLTGSLVKEIFGMSMSKGMEEQDFSAVYKTIKEL